MTNIDLKAWQYKRMLEERRGHNYQYPDNEQQIKNNKLGYQHHQFDNDWETRSEDEAKRVVKEYKETNHFARIVCYPNAIMGAKYYSVIYKKKKS